METLKFPEISVVVPLVVPFSMMVTPGRGSLVVLSRTVPVSVRFCASQLKDHAQDENERNCFLHFIRFLGFEIYIYWHLEIHKTVITFVGQ